jgi:hypothetical protein
MGAGTHGRSVTRSRPGLYVAAAGDEKIGSCELWQAAQSRDAARAAEWRQMPPSPALLPRKPDDYGSLVGGVQFLLTLFSPPDTRNMAQRWTPARRDVFPRLGLSSSGPSLAALFFGRCCFSCLVAPKPHCVKRRKRKGATWLGRPRPERYSNITTRLKRRLLPIGYGCNSTCAGSIQRKPPTEPRRCTGARDQGGHDKKKSVRRLAATSSCARPASAAGDVGTGRLRRVWRWPGHRSHLQGAGRR